jgi:hypothetical protein
VLIAAILDQAVADMQDRAGRFAGRHVLVHEVVFLTALPARPQKQAADYEPQLP